ncbi:hypothetical protein M9Y10_005226 [Tritrichomonas musculus]|uniref:Uncharacterized protein n=1 Tax=Tritrichomonas musculus TaxID=1915356 RepID=A0ABR2JLX9_9EUKA
MNDLSTLGSKIEQLPHHIILVICCCGIFLSFFLPRLVHKYLNLYYSINAPILLTFSQFLAVIILSAPSLYRTFLSKKKLSTNLFVYIVTSITLLLSMILDNYSVHLFLDKGTNDNHFFFDNSFAIESLFKSPKVLPVMVGNIVFLKKKFSFTTIISICLMVCGFVGIALGDLNGTISLNNDNYNYLGIAAIVASMTLEAIAANLEEYILVYCNTTIGEAISIIFSFGTIITLICSILKGEFSSTISKFVELGTESKRQQFFALSYLFIYAFSGAIGIHFVFLSLRVFGSLQTVSLTSLRKVFNSCLLSFLRNDKQFTTWHALSLFLAFSGYALNIYHKIFSSKKNKHLRINLSNYDDNTIISSTGGSGGTRNLNDISDLNDSNDFSSPNYTIYNNANYINDKTDFEDNISHKESKDNNISSKYNLLTNPISSLFGIDSNSNPSEVL